MIINGFKNGIFPFNTEIFPEGVDREDEDEDEFYATRGELETIPELPDLPTDMPELETEESAAERRNQRGQGLKILIPEQMLSRLLISLAQLKAGNNSQKL